MWLVLGFGAWLACIIALCGVLNIGRRESRREEEDTRRADPPHRVTAQRE
jgi:hypothetical protein